MELECFELCIGCERRQAIWFLEQSLMLVNARDPPPLFKPVRPWKDNTQTVCSKTHIESPRFFNKSFLPLSRCGSFLKIEREVKVEWHCAAVWRGAVFGTATAQYYTDNVWSTYDSALSIPSTVSPSNSEAMLLDFSALGSLRWRRRAVTLKGNTGFSCGTELNYTILLARP